MPVTPEMLEAVGFCLDWVRSSDLLEGRVFHVEQQLHLGFVESTLGQPMWGFADVLAPRMPVVVVDAKFGHNPVPASSVQLGLYVLAAVLEETRGSLEQEGLAGTSVILQPAATPQASTHEWTFAALQELRDEVIDVCRHVRRKDWTYAHGDWCRWCPALAVCPHIAAVARDAALAKVVPTPELIATGEISPTKLDEWLANADVLEMWIKQLNAVAEDYLRRGGRLDTRKLVRKRTVRRWKDEAAAVARLQAADVDPYNVPTVITPAEAERRLPSAKRGIVDQLSEKPEGELTITHMGDSKPAVIVAEALKSALESSVAAGYLARGRSRQEQPELKIMKS